MNVKDFFFFLLFCYRNLINFYRGYFKILGDLLFLFFSYDDDIYISRFLIMKLFVRN